MGYFVNATKLISVTKQCFKKIYQSKRIMILIVISFLLVGCFIGIGARYSASVKSRTVKFGFEDIGELATQAGYFTNVQKLEKYREIFDWQVPFTQSKYIFSYSGTIKAGIDFADVQVSSEGNIVYISIPEPKVLSCEIDPHSFELYDETNNIFTPLKMGDVNSSFQAITEEATSEAIENGLLENALSNARVILKAFVESVYSSDEYEYVFQ